MMSSGENTYFLLCWGLFSWIVHISYAAANDIGENECKDGQYFDPHLPGCDRCDQMCARATVEEVPSACSDFCKREATPGGLSGSPPAMTTPVLSVLVLASVIITVAIIVIPILFLKRKKIPQSWRFWKKKPTVKTPVQETQPGREEHDSLVEGDNQSPDQQGDISLHERNMV